jgi:hypothetical protein
MKYPDSGVHFSLPLLVARVRSSLKLRVSFVLRQRGRFFCSVFVVFAALLRCCTKRTCTRWRHALSPLSRLSSLLCADDFIIIAADLFSGPLRFLTKQRHYLDCLTLRSTGASERVAWQTCWRRREDLKLGTFKPWFSVSFCVALWCKICNDVQTASVRLLYRSSSYHYVPSLQSVLCGCCWRCLFRFLGEVSSFKGRRSMGIRFLFLGICCCVRVYTICTSSSGSLSSAVLHCWTWRSHVRVWYDVYGQLYLLKFLGRSIG